MKIAGLLPWLFFAAGVALAFRYANLVNGSPGESGLAAITLLRSGVIGNPYLIPTGPTAHVSPPLVWLLAAVYRLFGANSAASDVALGIVASLMYALSIRTTLQICAVSGLGRASVWIACGLFVLLPFLLFQAVVNDRQWDQPFAALLLVQGWLAFERSRHSERPYGCEAALAAITGIGALFSPAIFPPLAASLAGMIWMRRKRGDYRLSLLLSAGIVAACLLPWGIRNQIALGHFILTRSNFGLELATGNAPGALGFSGSGDGAPLHPHNSLPAAQEVARIGEVPYMQEMRRQAVAWIAADPLRFVRLTLARIRLSFLPVREMVGWQPALGEELPWVLLVAFGVVRIAALAAAFVLRVRPVLGVLYTVLPLAPYFVTHVNLRYLLPTFFPSVVLIAFVADRVIPAPRTPPRRHS